MSGVGSLIKEALSTIGIDAGACDCIALAKEWDNHGIQWCREHKAEIMEHLEAKAAMRKLPFPVDIVSRLVDGAFALAEQEMAMKDRDYEDRVRDAIKLMRGPAELRPIGWEWREETQEAMRRYLDEFAARDYPYPEGHAGRGIVILGGGRYFAAGYVLVRALRMLGCDLPIEWWYLSSHELDHHQERLLQAYGPIECVRLEDRTDVVPRIYGGWQAKIWAIMYSKFQEVLYLDADNFPVCDPQVVFDHPEYLETGAILWPDLLNNHGYDISREAFKIAGIPLEQSEHRGYLPDGKRHDKPTCYTPIESGQIVVDKSRCWQALELTKFLNEQSDFWFRPPAGQHKWLIYGDKSTFYLGFNVAKQAYHTPKSCEWFGELTGGGFSQYLGDYVLLQHRCNPPYKVRISGKNPTDGLIQADLFASGIDELRKVWKGKIWAWEHQSAQDLEVAKKQIGDWTPFGLPPIKILKDGGKTNDGRYTWRVVHVEGQPQLILVDGLTAVAFLGESSGHWVNNDARLCQAPPKWFSSDRREFDSQVWSETVANEYRLPDRLDGLNVLDIGGHCGMFAWSCWSRGAKQIISVEPVPANFAHLANNAKSMPTVTPLCAAVWVSWGLTCVQNHGHSGSGRVDVTGSLTPTIPLDHLLRMMHRVDILKLDCEGAEWPLLFESKELGRVQRIVGEYHLAEIQEWQDKYPSSVAYSLEALVEGLEAVGFTVTVRPNAPEIGLFFADR